MPDPSAKECRGCSQTKPLDAFSPAARGKYGRAYYCRTCAAVKARQRTAAASPEVRARNAERMRTYLRDNPEQRAKDNVRTRAWARANPDAMLEYQRAWRAANGDRCRAFSVRYRESHPEVGNAAVQRRRARLASAESEFTAQDWREVQAEFGNACAYCLVTGVRPQMDHLRAISNGGGHVRQNIVPACAACNNSKGRRDLLQFLEYSTRKVS